MSTRIAADPIIISQWVDGSFNPGLIEIGQGVNEANTAVSGLKAQAPNLGIIRTNTVNELTELGDAATIVLRNGALAVGNVVDAIMGAGGSQTKVELPDEVTFTIEGVMLEDGDIVDVDDTMFGTAAAEIQAAHTKISTAGAKIKDDLTAISEEAWQGESRIAVVEVINKLIGLESAPRWNMAATHSNGVVSDWVTPENEDLQGVSAASLSNIHNSLYAVLNVIKDTDKAASGNTTA